MKTVNLNYNLQKRQVLWLHRYKTLYLITSIKIVTTMLWPNRYDAVGWERVIGIVRSLLYCHNLHTVTHTVSNITSMSCSHFVCSQHIRPLTKVMNSPTKKSIKGTMYLFNYSIPFKKAWREAQPSIVHVSLNTVLSWQRKRKWGGWRAENISRETDRSILLTRWLIELCAESSPIIHQHA